MWHNKRCGRKFITQWNFQQVLQQIVQSMKLLVNANEGMNTTKKLEHRQNFWWTWKTWRLSVTQQKIWKEIGYLGEVTIKGARGTKVKVLSQGLHMTCVIFTLVYKKNWRFFPQIWDMLYFQRLWHLRLKFLEKLKCMMEFIIAYYP
jgi:hypothetical protein